VLYRGAAPCCSSIPLIDVFIYFTQKMSKHHPQTCGCIHSGARRPPPTTTQPPTVTPSPPISNKKKPPTATPSLPIPKEEKIKRELLTKQIIESQWYKKMNAPNHRLPYKTVTKLVDEYSSSYRC
jgi:hypothetical protein